MGCQGKEGIKKQQEFLSGIENISNGIKEFIQDIKGVKTGKKSSINLGQVDSRTTGAIKEKLNIDISDYTRVIDNFAINHVFKRHGGDIEYKRGQIPITDDDFLFYQDIVTKWDSIKTSTTKQGRDAIIYEKQYLDTVYVVEEIRTGKKDIFLQLQILQKNLTHR